MIRDVILILLLISPLVLLLLLNKYSQKNIEKFTEKSLFNALGLVKSSNSSKKDITTKPIKVDSTKIELPIIIPEKPKINIKNNIIKKIYDNFDKKIPIINQKTNNTKINGNIEKLDFQINAEKCNFYGSKCPNGYTEFGTFNIIDNSVLNNEKLKCDKEYSKDGESCTYCCKQ